jgi:hypothetical protein
MSQGKRGRPKKDPNRIIMPTSVEQVEQAEIPLNDREQKAKYKKLQLYYYFSIGREYLSSSRLTDYEQLKIRKKLEILDELNIPHVLGKEKILSPANLTDWVENLYQHRFELRRLRVIITRKTRLACAAQRIVRLFGLDIVYLDKVMENGRYSCRYRGADPHSDADINILNDWLERDRQAVVTDLTEGE